MADTLNIFGTEYTGVTGIIATTPSETDLTYIRPQGTKNISTNGTGIDVAAYASVDVSVSAPAPTLQTITKSYTPTESQQTETITAGSGYDGIEEVDVTVGAISSSYVGTGITRRNSTDLSASGATVSVPSGYYASNASKAVASGRIGNPSWSNEKTTTQFNITASYPQFTEGYISSINNAIRTFTLQEETVTPSTTTQIIEPSTANSYLNKVTVEAMPSGTAGTPTATKGTVSNHSVNVTPSVTNTSGYITGSTKTGTAVTVTASELASGNKEITQNGTNIDVVGYSTVSVNVSGGGGATNIVEGTFTTGTAAGYTNINLSYTGSGYPIAAMVFIESGAYNTANSDWYNSLQRYAVGMWSMSKSVQTSAPTYTTSGTQNQGVTTAIYKNSTSTSTSYTRTSAMNTNTYSSSNATNAAATCVRLKSGNVLSYYVNTSSYGLLPDMEYKYIVIYSS